MSLFDVIKYPISNPPKMSELSALPKDLFDKISDRQVVVTETSSCTTTYRVPREVMIEEILKYEPI